MIEFKQEPHNVKRDVKMIEVHNNGKLVAAIYSGSSGDLPSIKIVSKYMNAVIDNRAENPETIEIFFKRQDG